MIDLLVTLLLFAAVVYAVVLVLRVIPLPDVAKQIAYLILGIVFLLALLDKLGIYHARW